MRRDYCAIVSAVKLGGILVLMVVETLLLCFRHHESNSHDGSLPLLYALNVLILFVNVMENGEVPAGTLGLFSTCIFAVEWMVLAHHGLIISTLSEQLWKTTALFDSGQLIN
eukprot:NODE_4113_length_861_cov_11.022167_g3795_i0.p1 GENE.NODE_4113_length_861_cov_11.022167_g3795_i0~~NODE_4113_length_861_cov_11.022167_g3795_i0.p1  ORF type:complete len:112 (+),score=20.73 NODE_4113_length_861_cov_11.022167_g3795_i0:381-716(+)